MTPQAKPHGLDELPTTTSTRRTFQLAVVYILGGIMSFAMAIPTALYLLVPPRLRRNSKFIDVGDITQFTPGSPVNVSFTENRIDSWKVSAEKRTAWVVKEASGDIVAFSPLCTHLACAYHWEEGQKQFFCPCHNSVFSIDGKVVSGPAPRPLDRYETKIADNQLQIGALKRSAEG
jgi:menaquinol-cytochrome c reductase iron-sulfur subunit